MIGTFRTISRDALVLPSDGRHRVRLAFFARLRYQLIGAALVCVFMPALVRMRFDLSWQTGRSLENTVIATLVAVILGALILRRMTSYPGIWALSLVIPSFSVGFLIPVIAFFFVRIDYSRAQFIVSFALALAWFFFSARIERKVRRPRFLVLPFGGVGRLSEIDEADWVQASPLPPAAPADGGPQPSNPTVGRLGVDVSGVVADFRVDLPPQWEEFLAACALSGTPVYHSKQIRESLTGRVEIEHLSENQLGSLLPSSAFARFKRLADIAGALAVLPAFLLICLAVAVAIKLDDRGPVFFRQTRMGYRGRPFTILKFRSMRSEAASGGHFTEANDPRITRTGRFLRRYRVDEIPQIVNILRGEMSWIGPRPEAIPLSEWYQGQIPFYAYRHIVRPGITGWAQVNQGNVAEIEAATSKLHYDFFYIKNFSPWLDLLVVARTVAIVLNGFGAR